MAKARAKSKHRRLERPLTTPRRDVMATPSFEDYFEASDNFARVVRMALDQRGSVTRGEVRKALVAYENVIRASEREAATT